MVLIRVVYYFFYFKVHVLEVKLFKMNKKIGFRGLGQSVASLQGQGTGPLFLKPEMNHGTISEGVVLLVAKNIYLATGYADTLVVENVAIIPVALLGARGWGTNAPLMFFVFLCCCRLSPFYLKVHILK